MELLDEFPLLMQISSIGNPDTLSFMIVQYSINGSIHPGIGSFSGMAIEEIPVEPPTTTLPPPCPIPTVYVL